VRAVNRRGQRPDLLPREVEVCAADCLNAAAVRELAQGAAVLYQALNPPYHQWQTLFPALQASALNAAKAVGARYVSIENLYLYDSSAPISENSPIRPRSAKGALRARLAAEVLAAHTRGEVETTALRSSDYYGPGVTLSALGERVFAPLAAGGKAQLLGAADQPHSFAYIEDVGRAAALLGTRDDALGQAWIAPHAPARSQGDLLDLTGEALSRPVGYRVITPLLMRLAGLFNPGARASVEMMYQFTAPFVVASHRFEAHFGLVPTPTEAGIARTVAWYRARAEGRA
jgi:nucleoside-diphosphate-sugar epimerase